MLFRKKNLNWEAVLQPKCIKRKTVINSPLRVQSAQKVPQTAVSTAR